LSHLIGQYPQLGWAVAKTLLLFAVAVIGLRLAERRTLTQFNVFDLVVSIAAGAIVGRTATSSTTSFATGAAALITMLLAHRLVAVLCLRGLLVRRVVSRLTVRCGTLRYACGGVGTAGWGS
jgi:uncharacterized membrane protein YcaP (DUF421 family)